ncbi:MAG: M42 family peptidase [Gaiellaceae bacterium]
MPIPETLARLLSAPGPAGQEAHAAAVWREAASGFAEVSSDVLGSSVARVAGTEGGPLLAVVGHIDEIALVVTHHGEDGHLAVRGLGGWDPHVLLAQRVEILTRDGPIPGVVAVRQERRRRNEDRRPVELRDLYVDVGAVSAEESRSLVRVGDTAVIAGGPLELPNNRVASRSLDNRLGSYVALEAARRLAAAGGSRALVAAVAATQEEVGDFAGSRTTAFALRPDVAIAVDVTYATDVRGGEVEDDGEHKLGSGAAIGRGPGLHPGVFELLHGTAEAEGIPFTVEVSTGHTNTDADAFHLSRAGIPTGLVSIPTRYVHTPVEMVQLDDVEACIGLIVAFAQRLEPGTSFAR